MKELTFEQAMEKLQSIVAEMEQGDLPLESALSRFEEGMKLSRFLAAKLDEVQKKVAILMRESDGELREEPFEQEDSGEAQ
ncbi:MAG: exodeoxyribonuclease VII small subunit, partial [Deltaproteobacteria bacterium]|nr:exodeoxyribonuclease VII small subunit [Deltaproteobacteria bacterium]